MCIRDSLKPDREGKITAQQVLDAVDNQTVLVSMMAVNNEVGSVLPVAQVSRLLRKEYPRVLLHCDAVQAWCKQPLRLGKALDVDLSLIHIFRYDLIELCKQLTKVL